MLTQNYLVRMLARARVLAQQGQLSIIAFHDMLLNESLDASGYAALNDAHVRVALPDWAAHEDSILSHYAMRLLSRRDFHKSLRIEGLTTEMVSVVLPRLEKLVEQAGYDPSINVITARISKRGYMPYEQGILIEDGRDAADHSPLVRSLRNQMNACLFLSRIRFAMKFETSVREWVKPSQSSLVQFE